MAYLGNIRDDGERARQLLACCKAMDDGVPGHALKERFGWPLVREALHIRDACGIPRVLTKTAFGTP